MQDKDDSELISNDNKVLLITFALAPKYFPIMLRVSVNFLLTPNNKTHQILTNQGRLIVLLSMKHLQSAVEVLTRH